jgi:GntR family transcriptional repressor for pyruvate dehydrogenase complex
MSEGKAMMWESLAREGSLSHLIERRISEMLVSEQLKPGDRLPGERELATLLGVSRPSVREAVRSLEAQGMLNVRHGQGVFVAAPRPQQNLRASLAQHQVTLAELFAMREVLEVPAAGWAAHNHDLKRIERAEDTLRELNEIAKITPPDFEHLQQLDAAFHLRLVEAAGNRFLLQTLGVLQELLASGMETTLTVPGRLEKSRVDHERILTAIKAGDVVGARAAARKHIRAAHKVALRRLEAQSDPKNVK